MINCKQNRAKSACTHKVRESKQGDCTSSGAHDPSCFKKDSIQEANVLDVTDKMKELIDEVALTDLSWNPKKHMNLQKNILTLNTSTALDLLGNEQG